MKCVLEIARDASDPYFGHFEKQVHGAFFEGRSRIVSWRDEMSAAVTSQRVMNTPLNSVNSTVVSEAANAAWELFQC